MDMITIQLEFSRGLIFAVFMDQCLGRTVNPRKLNHETLVEGPAVNQNKYLAIRYCGTLSHIILHTSITIHALCS